MTDNKFLPRVWVEPVPHGETVTRCWTKFYEYAPDLEYISKSEVDALIAEKDRQLEIAREALEKIEIESRDSTRRPFYLLINEWAKKALRKLDGEGKE